MSVAPASASAGAQELERGRAPTVAVVVICTKNRPHEVKISAGKAARSAPGTPILVLDASTDERSRAACAELRLHGSLLYRRATRPGLARQRNEAIEICRELGAGIVHFIDDDTEVEPGYFQAIERRFAAEMDLGGVGGVVLNQPVVNFIALKSMFLLASRTPSVVLRSGRNVLGQYPHANPAERVQWLIGASMSYRMAVLDTLAFDEELEGYSMGEDYDFSYRVSRRFALAVEPAARCVHHVTPTMRGSARTHARLVSEATHRWVRKHPHLGMSLWAFWWSTAGDLLLRVGHAALARDRRSLSAAAGILEGVRAILCPRRA